VGSKTNGPEKVAGRDFPRNHEGHSGWTIDTVSNRTGISTLLPSPALDDDPNIILLHIGTNDVSKAPDGMEEKLERLIDSIIKDAPDALLVVAALIPSNRSSHPNSRIIEYNSKIPAIVKKKADNGAKIIFVDQYEGFPKTKELADKLHPNEAGYARMADKWFNAVETYLH
jgi:lysophospholipase L1-like esterase